jgi:glycine hydroxymethyltransferase
VLPGNGNKVLDKWLVPASLGYLVLNAVGWCHGRIQAGNSPAGAIGVTAVGLALLWTVVNIFVNKRHEARIGFADCAPFLVISQTSVEDVSGRLAGEEGVDVTKFRANIVVSGAERAFEEDFWAELEVSKNPESRDGDGGVGVKGKVRLLLTGNCVRCSSLNVDFQTGKMGTGESGNVLKKLMKDRRVDRGAKFSPVFGRYSFLGREGVGGRIRVGDEVRVSRRAEEYTVTGESADLMVWLISYLDANCAGSRLAGFDELNSTLGFFSCIPLIDWSSWVCKWRNLDIRPFLSEQQCFS